MYDELTGVANRRFADIKLRASLEELAEFNVPFGLLFVDVDHFKRVNDTFGHDVGDEVLRMVARTMEAALRPMDVVCRWGGEEFVVILPNMDAVTMERIAERLRFLIEKSWLDTDQGRVEVTASVGGAIAGPHDNHETVVRRADERMYFCKHHGRNLVSIG
jgi:diguanylate cyclase (GGDEF)-like protein